MTGRWAGSKGRDLPPGWRTIRAAVRDRAESRCEWPTGCSWAGAKGEADHIDDRNDHSLANLRWLCPDHHHERTSRQGTEAMRDLHRKLVHPSAFRKPPGLL